MSTTTRRRTWLALPIALSLAMGGLAVATPAVAAVPGGPFVTATPSPITAAEFETTGVRIQGQSLDTGGPIQRQDIRITDPAGATRLVTYFNPANPDDGTFNTLIRAAVTPALLGTYQVETRGFAGQANLAVATTTFEVVAELPPTDPPASITVTPQVISPDDFIADGVFASGRTFDNGGPINRSNLVLTAPDGATASYFDLTGDGTFGVTVRPKGDVLTQPLQTGTYTLTATSLLRPEFTATTTFVVQGEQAPPPATIAVTPTTITDAAFVATGVQATGRTFDSGSEVGIERSNLVLTSPSGATASYFDLTSDGTFDVNIRPKGAISSTPVELGTYTLTATSLQDPSFTATTTFVVTAAPVPPVEMDPFVVADPAQITVSEFIASGVNLSGFTEDTPGPLTRQDIFVTTPSGVETRCPDFTGDGTFDVQVFPQAIATDVPAGQRTCSLASEVVELGVYDVLSYGFIREDARATTTFEVVADPIDPPVTEPFVVADPMQITVSDFIALGVNLSGFTEDTPGPLTRQDIFVTTPSGGETQCADFTGDGTFDIQVYPQDAPDEGPDGQRTCSLQSDSVELGVYQVLSYGFIREDARATTTFEVIADAVEPTDPPVDPPVDPTPSAPAPTPVDPGAVGGAGGGTAPGGLPMTGAESAGAAGGIALLLMLLGGTVAFFARRRRLDGGSGS